MSSACNIIGGNAENAGAFFFGIFPLWRSWPHGSVESCRAVDLTRQQRRHSKVAFTLIELLVVISIIALLAALLLPVLTSARQHAHSLNCISNLRQVGIALQIYVQENGYYPLATDGNGLGEWQRALLPGHPRKTFCIARNWRKHLMNSCNSSHPTISFSPTTVTIPTGRCAMRPESRFGGSFITGASGNYVAAREKLGANSVPDDRAGRQPDLYPPSNDDTRPAHRLTRFTSPSRIFFSHRVITEFPIFTPTEPICSFAMTM